MCGLGWGCEIFDYWWLNFNRSILLTLVCAVQPIPPESVSVISADFWRQKNSLYLLIFYKIWDEMQREVNIFSICIKEDRGSHYFLSGFAVSFRFCWILPGLLGLRQRARMPEPHSHFSQNNSIFLWFISWGFYGRFCLNKWLYCCKIKSKAIYVASKPLCLVSGNGMVISNSCTAHFSLLELFT